MVKQIKTNTILKRYHKEEYIIGKNAEGGNIKKKGVLRCFKRVELSTFAIDTGDDLQDTQKKGVILQALSKIVNTKLPIIFLCLIE